MKFSDKFVTILGPTAVGKTRFSAILASKFNGEIISADSRQVYIGMDLGTGKDYEDYFVNGINIKAHLIDIIKPECEFNLYLFTQLFNNSFIKIIDNQKIPFVVGGTGLYLSAILKQYTLREVDFSSPRALELNQYSNEELVSILTKLRPTLHNTTDLIEKERIIRAILIAENTEQNYEDINNRDSLIIGLNDDREKIKDRIRVRLKQRLENGMIEEVQSLLDNGLSHEKLRFFGLEYKFISMYLSKEINYNDMHQKLASAIIQFSKRQMTWFRKMEKEGLKIHWLKNSQINEATDLIEKFIK